MPIENRARFPPRPPDWPVPMSSNVWRLAVDGQAGIGQEVPRNVERQAAVGQALADPMCDIRPVCSWAHTVSRTIVG